MSRQPMGREGVGVLNDIRSRDESASDAREELLGDLHLRDAEIHSVGGRSDRGLRVRHLSDGLSNQPLRYLPKMTRGEKNAHRNFEQRLDFTEDQGSCCRYAGGSPLELADIHYQGSHTSDIVGCDISAISVMLLVMKSLQSWQAIWSWLSRLGDGASCWLKLPPGAKCAQRLM